MKRSVLLFTIVLAASAMTAEDPKPPAAGAPSTAPLVEAAKGAKERRRHSSTKVITNADVKKSKGKIVERKAAGDVPETAPASSIEVHKAQLTALKAAEARVQVADTKAAELQKALYEIEQTYYEENDLDRRDGEIVRRFEAAKAALDAALAEQKAAHEALEPAPAAEPGDAAPQQKQ